jgi:hypothetical protein
MTKPNQNRHELKSKLNFRVSKTLEMLEISSELRSVEMEVIIIIRAAVLFMLAIWHNNPLPCCGNQHYCL